MSVDDIDLPPTFVPVDLQRKEPEPCYLPSTEPAQTDDNGNAIIPILDGINFKATFDPPLPISCAAASTILLCPVNEMTRSYASLLYDDKLVNPESPGDSIPLQRIFWHEPSKTSKPVNFRLNRTHLLPAITLREIPFGHPMEILTMLPVLRQWAWLHQVIFTGLGIPEQSTTTATSDAASKQPSSSSEKQKKEKKRRPTAQEVRAIIKAGGTWVPESDSSDASDSDDEAAARKGGTATKAGTEATENRIPDAVDVALDIPQPIITAAGTAVQSADVYITLTIPIGDGGDPVVAELCLQPGPKLVPMGRSVGDPLAHKIATALTLTEQMALVVMWLRDQVKGTVRESKVEDDDTYTDE